MTRLQTKTQNIEKIGQKQANDRLLVIKRDNTVHVRPCLFNIEELPVNVRL